MALAGCSGSVDRDQARVCRLTLVALAEPGASIAITSQREVTAPGGADGPFGVAPTAVRIDARATTPDGQGRPTFVECLYGVGPERLLLAAVRTPAGALSLPRLFALNRFWLAAADAEGRDPMPVEGLDAALRLPAGMGYGVQQALNAVPGAAVYALLAAAYSLIYGLVGRINLAFGAFAAIGGTATVSAVLAAGHLPLWATLALAGLASLVPAASFGIASSRLVFRPLRGATGQQVLVATIGLALVLAEMLRLTQGAEPRWIGPLMNQPVALARDPGFVVTVTPISLLVSGVAAFVSVALLLAMRLSSFGRQWRAYRDDPGAAALFGVGLDGIFLRTFALACALAGVAGGITVLVYGDITFAYAQTIGLKALTAAIIGGIGSVPGAVLGGLFIGLVESGWSAAFPIADRDLVVFCILIATLMWRPGGFLGDRDLLPRRV